MDRIRREIMGLLKEHQRSEYRFQKGDLIVFHPNKEQYIELRKIIGNNAKIDSENKIISGEYGLNVIRWLLCNLTTVGEEVNEYDDATLDNMLDNNDRDLKLLLDELIVLIEETTEDIVKDAQRQLKYFNDMLNAVSFDKDMEKSKKKFNTFCKKNKIDITFEEIINGKIKQDELLEKMNKGFK